MKLAQIIEAKYYRKPTLKQIEKRLQELSHETMRDDVYVSSGEIVNDKIHADFYVYGIEDEDDVVKAIERFLGKHGIPYTRVWNVINTTYRNTGFIYQATVSYDPKQIADRELTEARYYGKPTAREVRNRLKMLSKVSGDDSDVVMVDDAWQEGKSVEAAFTIYDTKEMEDVLYKVKQWLNDANIPYTQIKDLFDFSSGDEIFWSATMVYNEA